jgi:hypothetical protein
MAALEKFINAQHAGSGPLMARSPANMPRFRYLHQSQAARPDVRRAAFAFHQDQCCGFITLLQKATGYGLTSETFIEKSTFRC